MWEDHGEPETFIEALAKEDWTLSQVLAPLDGFEREAYLRNLYLAAFREGRDEQAAKLFNTVCAFLTGRTAPEGVAVVGPAEHLGRIGMSYWVLHSINPAMVRTHTAHLEAVISGLGASVEDDMSAWTCMRFLVDIYKERHWMRDVILAGVRKATGKGTKFTRIVALLSAGPQEELLRTVVNALVRNSDDASLKRTAELATLLDGCLPSAQEMATKQLRHIKDLDASVQTLLSELRLGEGWVSSKDSITAEYRRDPDTGYTVVRLHVTVRERIDYGKSDYIAVRKVLVGLAEKWQSRQKNTRVFTQCEVVSEAGTLLYQFQPNFT